MILDAKRGDVGSTAEFTLLRPSSGTVPDAVTVNPYLGGDSIAPFTKYADRGTILLCRTSNAGGADLQEQMLDGEPLYLRVAKLAATQWNANKNISLVVGATVPQVIADVRKAVGDMPLLVPRRRCAGRRHEGHRRRGPRQQGHGLVINASRSVIYASGGDDFARRARCGGADAGRWCGDLTKRRDEAPSFRSCWYEVFRSW